MEEPRILKLVWLFSVTFILEQKHGMVTTIRIKVFPGVLQTEQKYIGKWREAIEAEMNIQLVKPIVDRWERDIYWNQH